MTPSPELLEFLRAWEGPPSLRPRQDPVAPGVWDIGYGHVCGPNEPTITPQRADEMLAEDIEKYANAVRDNVSVELEQCEFDALTSFTLNVGIGAFAKSTLRRLVNLRDPDAADQFARWNKAGGREVLGLTKRRAAERAMFVDADYTRRP
jgi:lysozyme